MAKPIKVGIIGIGGTIGQTTSVMAKESDTELVALADPNKERRESVLQGLDDVKVFDDYHIMFDKCHLDAVCIGLPTWMHAGCSMVAMERGLHVLCEKPPAINLEEMKQVATLAAKKDVRYMFVRQPRFTAQLMSGRQLVQDGMLGDVYCGEVRWVRCRCFTKDWYHDKDKGGGVLLDLGIHAIDNAWFMMGCPQPIEVSAGLYCAFADYAPAEQIYTADDSASGFIRFDNGCTLNFIVAFSLNTVRCGGKSPEDKDGVSQTEYQTVNIYGIKGAIEDGRLLVGKPNGVKIEPMPEPKLKGDPVTLQAREFIRAIKEGDDPISSATQGVMLIQMLDGARQSSELGRSVAINRWTVDV